MLKRILISLALIGWTAIMTITNGININTIFALLIALPVLFFALYLIWIDSAKPYSQQWRYANRRKR